MEILKSVRMQRLLNDGVLTTQITSLCARAMDCVRTCGRLPVVCIIPESAKGFSIGAWNFPVSFFASFYSTQLTELNILLLLRVLAPMFPPKLDGTTPTPPTFTRTGYLHDVNNAQSAAAALVAIDVALSLAITSTVSH